ncbi:MAG: RidA family protein [Proteobacteria bacterium]|nr:MAG: RidA family protein [Pseudomonadota bacterium]
MSTSFKKVIETKGAPAPIGPYSQAVEAGGFLFCSGQIPLDPVTGETLKGSVAEQTELVMKNIAAVLKEASLDFANVVKTTIYLTNMADFPAVNEVYGKFFKTDAPARSTVAVAGLPKGVNVEVEVTARRA